MRNGLNPMRNTRFYGLNHGKAMRNALLYFISHGVICLIHRWLLCILWEHEKWKRKILFSKLKILRIILMQVSYWWIKQRNGTCYQTTISYFYLSFCFYELILKLIPCSNSFFIPLPVLFFFHAHFSLAPLRARVWYNNCLLYTSPSPRD